MNFKSFTKGFSLIEIVVGILIVGIGFVGATYAFSTIRSKSIQIEAIFRSVSLANSVMHTIRSENFDDNTSQPWTTSLGPEESLVSNFDDVDDYIGYSWDFQPEGFPGYDVTTRIYYVDPSVSWTDSVGTATNYKHIIVRVDYDGLESPIVLASLMTPKEIVAVSENDPCGTCGDGSGSDGNGDDDDDDDDGDDDGNS